MLWLLVCLFWLLVFASPLIASIFKAAKNVEVPKERWWFNGLWAALGIFALWQVV